jgi:glutathione S-transferase
VHPLFFQTVVNPNINKVPGDKAVIDNVLNDVQPKILSYLDAQIGGKYLVGDALTLADIAIVSNFIVYQYMGYEIDAKRYPRLARYLKEIAATDAYRKALDAEKPFVANMGLDRRFLDTA